MYKALLFHVPKSNFIISMDGAFGSNQASYDLDNNRVCPNIVFLDPPPLQNPTKLHIAVYTLGTSIERLGCWGLKRPLTFGRHASVCATILACVTLVRALVYCNFLREVRLGGWGSESPKGPTLGQYVSACATILLGSGRI